MWCRQGPGCRQDLGLRARCPPPPTVRLQRCHLGACPVLSGSFCRHSWQDWCRGTDVPVLSPPLPARDPDSGRGGRRALAGAWPDAVPRGVGVAGSCLLLRQPACSCPCPRRSERGSLRCRSWRGIGVGAGCGILRGRVWLCLGQHLQGETRAGLASQGEIWGRGLGTDWRGRCLRARLCVVPPTAIYTGAAACFLLEMSPPILSLLPAFLHPSFPSVRPVVGLALRPGWGGGAARGARHLSCRPRMRAGLGGEVGAPRFPW